MQKLNPDIWDKYSPTFESVDYSLIRLSPPAVLDDYSEVNQLSESFCIKHEQQQLSYDSSIQLQFRPNIAQSIDECYITPLCVQNNTKSLLLIKIFTTASPNLRERNLQLCNIFIHQLYDKSPRDILSNILFKNKCTCGTESDLIRCGFIAFLVGDYDMSVNIFYRALAKGSETASTMIGIILFYLYQKKKRALMFFSRAATNPLALAHLALVFSDNETYLLRLKDIVDEENEGLIYEKIGDAFWDGVLVPRNKVIAKLFYGVALDNYDKNFKDETNIIEKISRPIE
ncbi:hypothetical protein GPJ56_007362 [Histomonas meleagridis]|uniref:uncharacterized protein n=1 Tax=Histomonas meleagridis TaxID=135588 RepID=UPI00355A08AB|nr:hypothetical protein GPJ56_007362 [Histomonas meleagridis]KAH0804208.1 hypothetical protein GO595_003038 [Histomonas meleagridis]